MSIKELRKHTWFIGLVLLSATMIVAGIRCSNKTSTSSSSSPSSNITLTGVLTPGTAVVYPASFSSTSLTPLSGSPMAGYSLYCVTLSNPPVAGTSTADASGNFSLAIAAKDTPLGCFIMDTSSNEVAALVFSASTGTAGQTVSLSGSTNLGTITVDTADGIASAVLPSTAGTVVSTPSGASCPVGTWVSNWGNAWSSPCAAGNVTVTMYVVDTGSGLQATFNIGPVNIGSQAPYACGTYITATNGTNSTVAFSNNVIKFTMPAQCGSAAKTMELTVDSSCKTAALTSNTDTNCGDCTKPDTWFSTCNSCGSMTCPNTSSLGLGITFIKQ